MAPSVFVIAAILVAVVVGVSSVPILNVNSIESSSSQSTDQATSSGSHQFSYLQRAKFGGTFKTIVDATSTRDCEDVHSEDNPTDIEISKDGYKIITYSTRCNDPDHESSKISSVSMQANAPLVVNDRRPVRSFKLDDPTSTPVQVTFYMWKDFTSVGLDPKDVSDTQCVSLYPSTFDWTPYSQSVKLSKNGAPTAASIQIFSDANCNESVMSNVNTQELVTVTRKDNAKVVRSFAFVKST